jgi:O-antigen/teichoic acid export membrane protein
LPTQALRNSRATRWTSVLAAQGFGQVAAFICSLLIIRALTKDEYAVYTLAGVALGLVAQVSDLGAGSAMLSLGGRLSSDRLALGRLVVTTLRLRTKLLGLALLVGGAALVVLLSRVNVPLPRVLAITALVAMTASANFQYAIWGVTARLLGRVAQLQVFDSSSALTRVGLVLLATRIAPSATSVLAANLLPALVSAQLVRRWIGSGIGLDQPEAVEMRQALVSMMSRLLPNAIFYALYGQIAIVLLGLLGGATQVADVGALGRLAALLAVFSGVLTNLVLPDVACSRSRSELRGLYLKIVSFHLGCSLALLLVAGIFPDALLRVLGPRYAELRGTLVWVLLAQLVNSFVATVWSLNAARGWTAGVWLTIPCIVAAQILLVPVLDLATVKGAVLFGSLPFLAALLVLGHLARRGLRAVPV